VTARLLVVAAGGTGGHMFPAQALAETMLARGWRVRLATDARGARYAGAFPIEVERRIVRAGTTQRSGVRSKLKAPFQIAAGLLEALWSTWRGRPDCVAGFGGYPAFPTLAAAWLLGRPRLIHEQNAVPGRVNRLFSRRVHAFACGAWPTALPEGVDGIHVGNPVRASVLERAASAYTPPGDRPLDVLVIGGSQGASLLSRVAPPALASLPEALRARLNVSHQAREADRDEVVRAYAEAGIGATVAPFFHDVAARMAKAQLIVSRAGAASIADLAAIGRPSILVPLRIARRGEQAANAREPAERGAATILTEDAFDPPALAAAVERILSDPDLAVRMAEAALSLGMPDAAERLGDLVERVADR